MGYFESQDALVKAILRASEDKKLTDIEDKIITLETHQDHRKNEGNSYKLFVDMKKIPKLYEQEISDAELSAFNISKEEW